MNFVELNVVQCLKDPCLSHFQFIVNPRLCWSSFTHFLLPAKTGDLLKMFIPWCE